jgi:hypothetical protein
MFEMLSVYIYTLHSTLLLILTAFVACFRANFTFTLNRYRQLRPDHLWRPGTLASTHSVEGDPISWPGSSVGIATRYGLDGTGIESR